MRNDREMEQLRRGRRGRKGGDNEKGASGTERGEAKQGLWGRDIAVNEVE